MSAATAPPPPLDIVAGRAESAGPRESATALSRREATLRSAATTCLAGIALVQALGLPALLGQGWRFAVLSVAAMALCIALSLALAAAPASASRPLWRAVAATAGLVLAGWAAPHALAVPGLAGARGDWAAMPGTAAGGLAAVCLLLAAAAVRSARATARGVAVAFAVLVALGPGVGALLVALGPGPAGGETAITADVHAHAHATGPAPDIRLRPGRNGDHYVTRVTTPRHPTALGVALVAAAALVLVYGAVGHLRQRSAPPRAVAGPGIARGRA